MLSSAIVLSPRVLPSPCWSIALLQHFCSKSPPILKTVRKTLMPCQTFLAGSICCLCCSARLILQPCFQVSEPSRAQGNSEGLFGGDGIQYQCYSERWLDLQGRRSVRIF